MKISAILYKVGKEDFNSLKAKLARAIKDSPDIVICPDAALDCLDSELSSREHKQEVYNQLILLSSNSNSLIIPGTITYPINNKEIVCEALVFHRGKLLNVFRKERDNGESKLASENGLVYKKGDNSKNKFYFNDKQIALEICGDHGRQDVRECDLELILAFDSKAGFWLSASNDNFRRNAVVCDGYAPKAEAFDYNPDRNPKLKVIEGKKKGGIVTFEV